MGASTSTPGTPATAECEIRHGRVGQRTRVEHPSVERHEEPVTGWDGRGGGPIGQVGDRARRDEGAAVAREPDFGHDARDRHVDRRTVRVETQILTRHDVEVRRGPLIDDDLVRSEVAGIGDTGDRWVRSEVACRREVELHDLDLWHRHVFLWRFEGCGGGGHRQQTVDATDLASVDRQGDIVDRAFLGGQRDVDRAVLRPSHVGERRFDDVTDHERGGDDGRAEECPGDDQNGLRPAAADVAQGHGEEGPLPQCGDRERSQQEERNDSQDREGGHAITGSAVRSSSTGSPSSTTSPSRTCTRRWPDRPRPSSWVTTTSV